MLRSRMSTLSEIERAVDQLPLAEQEQLLRSLTSRVRPRPSVADPVKREQWVKQLRELRASIGTGGQESSSEQILEDLRAERI